MSDPGSLWVFWLLVLGVVAVPGMDVAFIMGSALVGGARAGFAAVAGIATGVVAHIVMATAGLSALVKLFPAVANTLLAAGALYMGWIGWTMLRSEAIFSGAEKQPQRAVNITFRRGVLTNLLNPKAYLFNLAVFPRFLFGQSQPLLLRAALMGLIVIGTICVVYGALAVAAGGAQSWLRHNAGASRWINRAVGALLLAAAAWIAVDAWRSNA